MSDEDRTIYRLQYIIFALLGLLALGLVGALFYRRLSSRRIRLASLNSKVRELELTAIRAQMNPHFLYNSLNSIQNLLLKNELDDAHAYLASFASLIRKVLKNSSREEISLHEELEMIREYVQLEQLRFDFQFELNVEDGLDLYTIFIPPLLLQPIVENAIIHGLVGKEDNRLLTVEIRSNEKSIYLSIRDNGVGRNDQGQESRTSTGKGLEFSEERLELLSNKYGERYSLDITDLKNDNGTPVGTIVKIVLPLE